MDSTVLNWLRAKRLPDPGEQYPWNSSFFKVITGRAPASRSRHRRHRQSPGCRRWGGQLAETLGAARACFLVKPTDGQDVDDDAAFADDGDRRRPLGAVADCARRGANLDQPTSR